MQKLSEVQKQQAQQAELALEDFKSQVERNSGRMFDEMKAQVKIIPLSVIRLAVSQFARQSLSICCHHSTLGTDCASSPEILACSSGDSWLTIEESAVCGCVWGAVGGGISFRFSLARAQRSYVCSQRPLAKGKWKL